MIAFGYYLLKVIFCSGLLFLYYHVALRNKLFHQWNRFYLLATIALSLTIPCLEFNVASNTETSMVGDIKLLQAVYIADAYVAASKNFLSTDQWTVLVYSAVSAGVLILFILALLRIRSIIRSHHVVLLEDIKFLNTEEKDAPFSFLNYVFWNRQIDLESSSGKHIFQHELAHIREKHSLDKIFLQCVLIVFWCNPFFWFIKKELRTIHEFIADKKSVADPHAFAAMILNVTYPKHHNYLTNHFFQSSIKRRLAMFTKKHNPTNSYISRLLVLPLCAFILFACSVKDKKDLEITTPEKEIAIKTDSNQPVITLADSTQTKNSNPIGQADPNNKVYEKVEVEAQFPGGLPAWRRFLERNLNAQVPSDAGAPTGSYTVIAKFIVDHDGNISDVKTLTKHGYGMEEEVKRVVRRGPKWTPAIDEGKNVTAYRQQPITFVIADQ
jgi:hypothetical protein